MENIIVSHSNIMLPFLILNTNNSMPHAAYNGSTQNPYGDNVQEIVALYKAALANKQDWAVETNNMTLP